MNNIVIILALIAIIIILIWVIFSLKNELKEKEKRIENLKAETEKEHYNLEKMLEYFDKILEVANDEKKTEQKIDNAKTDEELFSIVSDIVNANNRRVQDRPEG